MRTRRLGAAGPEVSVLGLGCNNLGMRIGPEPARAVVDAALEAGVTLFDTADVYAQGDSERFLGAALGDRRDRIVLATKWGMAFKDAPELPRGSPAYVRWAVEGSLRRLGTDWIDVYQYHRHDGETPFAATFAALAELVRAGTIRYVGVSTIEADQLADAVAAAREVGLPLVSLQRQYSLVRREVEDELLPACERLGIGLLPYYPLESGLLTGKYRRGEPPPDGTRFAGLPSVWPADRWMTDAAFDRVDALERYAGERERTLLEVAIGGLAAMPAVTSVIAGATTPEQVRANAAAAAWAPGDADLTALKELPR